MNFPSKSDCVVPLVWFKSINWFGSSQKSIILIKIATTDFGRKRHKLEMREYRREGIEKNKAKRLKC